jgi:hypothetical protein
VHEAEGDEGRDEERLVGRRVEERPERGLRVREARDRSVEAVGEAGGDEDGECFTVAQVLEQDQKARDRDDP